MWNWMCRKHVAVLTLAAGSLCALNGCGLSDQQWATVWQSVLTSALNTIVSTVVTGAAT